MQPNIFGSNDCHVPCMWHMFNVSWLIIHCTELFSQDSTNKVFLLTRDKDLGWVLMTRMDQQIPLIGEHLFFYHAQHQFKRKKNQLKCLKGSQGSWNDWIKNVCSLILHMEICLMQQDQCRQSFYHSNHISVSWSMQPHLDHYNV